MSRYQRKKSGWGICGTVYFPKAVPTLSLCISIGSSMGIMESIAGSQWQTSYFLKRTHQILAQGLLDDIRIIQWFPEL